MNTFNKKETYIQIPYKKNNLTILHVIREKGKKPIAVCKCDCGVVKNIKLGHVKNGSIKSCGCLRKKSSSINGSRNKKHGQSITGKRGAEYRSWEGMKSRCDCPKNPFFSDYGGRGIKVCDRWQLFENFYEDMGERPKGTTLDRIDNNGDYYPENCRWASHKVQSRNKRNNRIIIFKEKEMPLIELQEKTGIPYQRLYERIVRNGWSVDRAVYTPVDKQKINKKNRTEGGLL